MPRLRVAAGALVFGVFCRTTSAAAYEQGYDIWFSGRIVAVDVHRDRLRIVRGPTETSDAAIIECEMPRRALRKLHIGMDVAAEADTRHIPWRILHLRPLEHLYRRGLPVSTRTNIMPHAIRA